MITKNSGRASYQFIKFNEQRFNELRVIIKAGAFSQFDRFQSEAVPVIAGHIQRATAIAILALAEGDNETAAAAMMSASNSSYDLTRAYERDED